MTTVASRRLGFICQSCKKSLSSNPSQRQFSSLSAHILRRSFAPTSSRKLGTPLQYRTSSSAAARSGTQRPGRKPTHISRHAQEPEEDAAEEEEEDEESETDASAITPLNPTAVLGSLKKDVSRIIATNATPSQDTLIQLLDLMYQFSNVIIFGINKGPNEVESKEGEDLADSVLRDLAEGKSDEPIYIADKEMSAPFREDAARTVAELAWTLVRDPKIFISPDVLNIYSRVQCLLGKPEYLPEIFNLYAHKKVPIANSSPIKYSEPWPKMPKYAVPYATASVALEAAILKKNLPLALAIIDTTVATPAFRANKVLTRASIPLAGVAGMPILAYAGATYVASTQNTMDFELSKYTAIAAAMAYVTTLTTIGFVAITTTNDQMERVVWRPGTHLSARWLREEEREFFDRLALAWGFQNKSRWGEEQSEEWQVLKDECGLRDMILDKTDLMEGMQ